MLALTAIPGGSEQGFGHDLLSNHDFILIPSVVSTHGWNLILDPHRMKALYPLDSQADSALDTRLHPPAP